MAITSVIEMTIPEWIAVKDNPRQRDTERHARIAANNHLSTYSHIHRIVWAAIDKGGNVLCKLDGHTRSYLWENSFLDVPPEGTVLVILVSVANMQEAKMYYDQLDNSRAAKKPSDAIFGACRENGISLHSPLLRLCQFSTQLKIANGGWDRLDISKMIRTWKPYLIELDCLALSNRYSLLIAVMLRTIRSDGIAIAGPFWTKLDNNEGVKRSNGSDGIQQLHSMMEVRKAAGSLAGYANLMEISARAYEAYQGWKDGKLFTRVPRLSNSFSQLCQSDKPKSRKVVS